MNGDDNRDFRSSRMQIAADYRAMLCIRGTSHGPVSVSVCLSQVGVLLKRLNLGSHKQHHTIPQGVYFSDAKVLREI